MNRKHLHHLYCELLSYRTLRSDTPRDFVRTAKDDILLEQLAHERRPKKMLSRSLKRSL
jgi:hypothetical protein